jgi:hypothetical protein
MRHPKYELYGRGGCKCQYGPRARRLYVREGPRSKQRFVPWGVVCLDCGFIFPNTDNAIETMKEQIKWTEQQRIDKPKRDKQGKEAVAKLLAKVRR